MDRIAAEVLGDDKARYMHCHFSKIEWTAAGEKARLQKALTVREYLLDEFGDSSEAQEGLRFAMDNIRRAMQDIDSGMRLTAHKPLLKHLLTACRKAVSLFVPLPRP